jgi:hypothetical protein
MRHSQVLRLDTQRGGPQSQKCRKEQRLQSENGSSVRGGNDGLMESEENKTPFPSLPTALGNRQTTSISTLRTARRRRSFMMTKPLCRNSDALALQQHNLLAPV